MLLGALGCMKILILKKVNDNIVLGIYPPRPFQLPFLPLSDVLCNPTDDIWM
jgi:hypothetical protein